MGRLLRVAVLGPGGVGGLLGGVLGARGAEVTVLARPATTARIAAGGLTVHSATLGELRVPVRAAARLEAPVDCCLVTVKATQLADAVAALPAAALGDALVVPFLNGVDHLGWLRARYPAGQVAAGTIRVEATRVAPGVVEHASPFAAVELAVPPDGLPGGGPAVRDRVERLAGALAAGGLDVAVRDDEAATLWRKLGVLAPIALLTTWAAAPLGEARTRHPELAAALVREVAAAAAGAGVTLDPDLGGRMLAGAPAGMRSSMQKDAAAGSPIELDAIGGAVLRAAARAGIEVPAVERVVADLAARYPAAG